MALLPIRWRGNQNRGLRILCCGVSLKEGVLGVSWTGNELLEMKPLAADNDTQGAEAAIGSPQ